MWIFIGVLWQNLGIFPSAFLFITFKLVPPQKCLVLREDFSIHQRYQVRLEYKSCQAAVETDVNIGLSSSWSLGTEARYSG